MGQIGKYTHKAFAGIVVILSLAYVVMVVVEGGRGVYKECVLVESHETNTRHLSKEDFAQYSFGNSIITLAAFLPTAPVAACMLAFAATPYLRRVSEYALVLWTSKWMHVVSNLLECSGWSYWIVMVPAYLFALLYITSFVMFLLLLLRQVRALEDSSYLDLGSSRLRSSLRRLSASFTFTALVAMSWNSGLWGDQGEHPMRVVTSMLSWARLAQMIHVSLLPIQAIGRVQRLASGALLSESARALEEARQAPRFLRLQQLGVAAGLATSLVWVALFIWSYRALWPLPDASEEAKTPLLVLAVSQLPGMVDTIFNSLASLAISGAFFGALSGGRALLKGEAARLEKWTKAAKEWSSHPDADWQAKVAEMACRGVSLQALLGFYRRLGKDLMPGFDPSRHTTHDVVFRAIIPESSHHRKSMAQVMMEDKRVEPEIMVTHNWQNLFSDLISAIVADALGEKEYCRVSHLLLNDIDTIESWIDYAGVGQRTYWVCAFSVNQHTSTCESTFGLEDSVTGEKYPACRCGLPKAFNKTPPLSSEGQSIECEMNKFEPMVQTLSARSRNFSQLVAVDRRFEVFNRAWCVAEIAASNSMGMVQRLQLPSRRILQENLHVLSRLEICSMGASRPEDKEEILRHISDHEAFDRRLRDMLLVQLLPSWSTLDSRDHMFLAGRVARWQVAACRLSSRVWDPDLEGTPGHPIDL
ncbi:unnamed protein product [Prorocentrum cordatum]|uniref:Uncharacterized protein n=1 Tax=Prorocentrum cordatum TaxID=2364126 RepID=A0ABN9UEX5_9DINO|nr:unnamed protein product [Polarella glacialis]